MILMKLFFLISVTEDLLEFKEIISGKELEVFSYQLIPL